MRIDFDQVRSSRLPDDGDRNCGWTIKRTGADGPMKLVIISSDMLGIRTHWFRGRTGPCLLENCEACKHGMLSRWKGYVLALETSCQMQCVFEFTPPGAIALEEARSRFGTMRGLQVIASRAGKKANSKVSLHVKGITVLGPAACPDYGIWPVVARIWGIDSDRSPAVLQSDVADLSEWERS